MSHPLSTEEVLKAEAAAIHGSDTEHLVSGKTGSALYQALNGLESAALCLSGGGIRSAAFALGVLHAFAIHPRSAKGEACQQAKDSLLAKFHYLSTVSGGGYIGSWLSAWRTRMEFPTIWARLTGRPGGADVEPHTVAWLRSFSNYLTPKLGVMSADAWNDIALFVRNLILNWLIIIPLVCALILLLKVVAIVAEWATHYDDWLQHTLAGCGAACLVAALAFTTRHRPSRRGDGSKGGVDQNTYLFYGLLWSVLSAALLAQFLASDLVGLDLLSSCQRNECPCLGNVDTPPYGDPCQGADGYLIPRWPVMQFIWLGMLAGGAIYALSWLLGRPRKMDVRDFACWSAAGCIYGAAVALGLYFYVQVPDDGIGIFSTVVMPIVFGVPWILVSQTVADMIFVGLSSYAPKAEDDREWLGRTGGWIIAAALGWLTLTFLAFFGAVFSWDDVWTAVPAWIAPLGGVSGLATAFLGSAGFSRARGPAKGVKSLSANLILSIVAPIFAAALIISLSLVLDQLLLGENLVPDIFIGWNDDWSDRAPTVQSLGLGFVFFFATAFVASLFININRFSLHALYRNRLVRAFLGASRDRTADPFTDFDDNDNPEMQSLWPPANPSGGSGDGGWAPFPVVNTTLNIVAAKKLAWQERKAASFTMTPLHCGYSSKCLANSDKPVGAFRASADFGGCITLGTAVAISGAAASPNMGYHSSPGITFLMTLFNVRLGWWLGNTAEEGKDTFMRDGPLFAIVPLAQETFGRTTDDKRYIYLSTADISKISGSTRWCGAAAGSSS